MTGHRCRRRQPADGQPVAVMRDTLILHVNCTLSLSSRVMAPASNHFPLLHPCEKVSMSPSYRDHGDQKSTHTKFKQESDLRIQNVKKHTVSAFWGMCLQFRLLCSELFLGGGNFHNCGKEHSLSRLYLEYGYLTWPTRNPTHRTDIVTTAASQTGSNLTK